MSSLRFLHTADVHLTAAAPERMDALRAVCRLAQNSGCSALLIAGDLFNTTEDAVSLRTEVRKLFDSFDYDVFLIPGNHDTAAFQSGEYYGGRVHTCSGEAARWELEGVPLLGIPYLSGRQGADLLRSHAHGNSPPLVVLMHTNFYNSSLSALYHTEEEDESSSACLWDCDLEHLQNTYIALGHWHNPTLPPVKINDVQVAYSGSPYPISRGENGVRRAFLIEVSAGKMRVKGVKIPGVPRRERVSFFFIPGEEMSILDQLGAYLEEHADSNVILDLEVAGWVESLNEDACAAEVEMLVGKYRHSWGAVNTGTLQITGSAALPGIALRCLQLLRDSEPPHCLALEDCSDPCLLELARKVGKERQRLYRSALSLLLQQMGRGR